MTAQTEKITDPSKPLRKIPESKQFSLEEFKLELRRIEWPSRKEVAKSASAVLIILITFVIFVLIVDSGIAKLIQLIQMAR